MTLKLSAALLLFASSLGAQACSCSFVSPDGYFSKTSLAFSGRVIEVKAVTPCNDDRPSCGNRQARFALIESIKGPMSQEVEINYTEADGANCGRSFRVGETYTVSARGDRRQGFSSNACSGFLTGSALLATYQAERQRLAAGLAAKPDDHELLLAQGAFYLQAQEFDDAHDSFAQLLRANADDARALAGRGAARFGQQQFAEALQDFLAALLRQPNLREALQGRQAALIKLKRFDEVAGPGLSLNGYVQAYRDAPIKLASADLKGSSLRAAQLQGADFSHADLRGSDFEGAKLMGVSFVSARLDGATFKATDLGGSDFSAADLRGADFSHANLRSAKLGGAQLEGAIFRLANFSQADLSNTRWEGHDLSGLAFEGADLRGAVFSHSSLNGARFKSIWPDFFPLLDLRGTDLSGASLDGVVWGPALVDCRTRFPADFDGRRHPLLPLWSDCPAGTPLPQTGLSAGYAYERPRPSYYPAYALTKGMVLHQVVSPRSAMQGLNLAGYRIADSQFDGSDFSQANLADLSLDQGSFESVNFGGANLQRARMWGTRLNGADFRQADLRGAIFLGLDLRKTQLAGARFENSCYGAGMRWPAGFKPEAAGIKPCPVQ
nr:pentapeptide repeat-containing protein [uncultured Roseateles sp.]